MYFKIYKKTTIHASFFFFTLIQCHVLLGSHNESVSGLPKIKMMTYLEWKIKMILFSGWWQLIKMNFILTKQNLNKYGNKWSPMSWRNMMYKEEWNYWIAIYFGKYYSADQGSYDHVKIIRTYSTESQKYIKS